MTKLDMITEMLMGTNDKQMPKFIKYAMQKPKSRVEELYSYFMEHNTPQDHQFVKQLLIR